MKLQLWASIWPRASSRLHGVDTRGTVVLRRQLTRKQLRPFLAKLSPCLVGMEACAGAHYWAREIERLGHTVSLMSPHFVTPSPRIARTRKTTATMPRRSAKRSEGPRCDSCPPRARAQFAGRESGSARRITWLANFGMRKMLGYRGRAERVEFNFATPSLAVEGLSLAKYHGCKTEQLLEITLPHAPRSSGSQSAGRSDPGQGARRR
jgi:hypothetical protein